MCELYHKIFVQYREKYSKYCIYFVHYYKYFQILHIAQKRGSISTPIYAVCTKVYNMHNSKGLKLCNFAKVYKVHKTISLKLCNFAKVYNMHNFIKDFCATLRKCATCTFFSKNLTCFVQGSQYRVFIVQSAESSPKMLKIFMQNSQKESCVVLFAQNPSKMLEIFVQYGEN